MYSIYNHFNIKFTGVSFSLRSWENKNSEPTEHKAEIFHKKIFNVKAKTAQAHVLSTGKKIQKTVRHSEAEAENSDVFVTAATATTTNATTATITASRRRVDQLPILAADFHLFAIRFWQFGIARSKGNIAHLLSSLEKMLTHIPTLVLL